MSFEIHVRLPAVRRKLGQIRVIDTTTGLVTWGPIPCLGLADRNDAANAGNPNRDTRHVNGNFPLGEYQVTGTLGPNEPRYGSYPRLVLVGVLGDAAVRETLNPLLRIHGGPLVDRPEQLNGTNGCLRLADYDMRDLLSALRIGGAIQFPVRLVAEEGEPDIDIFVTDD